LLGLLINYCEQQQIHLHGLRQAWVSGDWVPLTLAERLRSLNPAIKVTSMGGATEASIWSITYPIQAIDSSWQSIPYGKAMHNQAMYVLNHRLEICPNWVTGEIYIGGIGLAKGYWKDPEKTAAAFINHPVSGARLYKTGDLGLYRADGNIEFLGRTDFQIKVQGYRIELGEIEQALCNIAGVKEALVSAVGELCQQMER
jgi:non-ribosomal peptide synthetase component F